MAFKLTGSVIVQRISELLEKLGLTSAELSSYSVAIDNPSQAQTERIPLDKLKLAMLNSGLYDDRGFYDASVNVFPSSGGSGTAGAILRGNVWTISVSGTLGGTAVIEGQEIRALVDNPGQTAANWFISLANVETIWGEITGTLSDQTDLNNKLDEKVEVVGSNAKYGRLYNYYAISNANFAPEGWHVATRSDYQTLLNLIDTYSGVSESWPLAGDLLKEASLIYWGDLNEGTNDYNFNARGSGYRDSGDGTFNNINVNCLLWASDLYQYYFQEDLSEVTESESTGAETVGASVRLVKDDSVNPGSLTDLDGNVYRTVKIGNQVWLADNWACTQLNDGTPISNITDDAEWLADTSGAYCDYDNDIKNSLFFPTFEYIDNLIYVLEVALSQLDTDLTATTGVAKFPCPEDMTITEVFVQVTTAPTGSAAQWDINVEGSSILSTKVTIDAGEYSSLTAATPPVISSADVDKGELITVDRDQIGATVPGQNDVLVILYKKR